MTIVLDENAWAKQMIDTCSLGRKPYETLYRVARYYIDNGSSRRDARRKLEIFMGRCDPLVSIPKWSKTIDYALSRALKTEAVKIDCIPVTTAEIETIRGLEGKQQQRLAFTLLCLAKYWNIVIIPSPVGSTRRTTRLCVCPTSILRLTGKARCITLCIWRACCNSQRKLTTRMSGCASCTAGRRRWRLLTSEISGINT